MKTTRRFCKSIDPGQYGYALVCMMLLSVLLTTPMEARTFTVNVLDDVGTPLTGGFRWLVEEDNTHPVIPGAQVSDSLSLNIHTSYAPVVMSGEETAASSVSVDLPDGRYVISILPMSTIDSPRYTLGGSSFTVGPPPAPVSSDVVVYPEPIPTAQISVLVFHDYWPLNGEPDKPEEEGFAGFSVIIFDIFGQMMTDVFGNPLGTTYVQVGPDWVVDQMGSGIILTDENGEASIRNIAAGRYGVRVIPPTGSKWVQTSTIEGTPGIDAWVKANNPAQDLEGWGPGFYHVFIGFTEATDRLGEIPNPGGTVGTVTGQFINNHVAGPPQFLPAPGAPVSDAWVGLNLLSDKKCYYVQQCDADGSFSISNVPPGTYQVAFFDTPLDWIFGFSNVVVPPTGGWVEMGRIPQFAWFGSIEGQVFYDSDADGFPDPGERGMANQAVNLRFRDGSVYMGTVTDPSGMYSFAEIFPFFKWLVMEVDFLRYKPTGATFVVDAGGPVPPHNGWSVPSFDKLNPQPQAEINVNTGNNLSRTETGPVVLESFILQAGEPNIAYWGKQSYLASENGGISGVVRYATTRAEDDPRFGAPEDWEPGIPRVQINRYEDFDNDLIPDDLDQDGMVTLADADNHPLGDFPGPGDIDQNGNGEFDLGDAVDFVYTDSWDDNLPTGCIETPLMIHGEQVRDCIDNFRSWNQMRPGVFDGGYLFDLTPSGDPIPPGYYIIEAVTPPGYELVKEEDKNVDFGDGYEPGVRALPPVCVGDPAMFGIAPNVPDELSLFPGVPCANAGAPRTLCNMKQVTLHCCENTACDFYFFTKVPKATRAVGLVLNDLGATFSHRDPMQGEKPAPSWIPVSFQDWTGREIARTYTDEFGGYNALLPSTFTANIPAPSGMSPNMLTMWLNDPGPIPDPGNPGQFITDPWYDPRYAQAGHTRDFLPGKTTYVDTPILPLGSFRDTVSSTDCAFPDGTPWIKTVSGPGQGGPYVSEPGLQVTITAMGHVEVPNPDYNPENPDPAVRPTLRRDYTFGQYIAGRSSVTVGGVALTNLQWANDGRTIRGTVPAGMQTGQLIVTRGDNLRSSILGVTLHVGSGGGTVRWVNPGPPNAIQAAIDASAPGDLIIVNPGYYWENLIISEKIRLQGWGAGATVIDGSLLLDPALQAGWTTRIQELLTLGASETVPGQDPADPFLTVVGPAILVFPADGAFTSTRHAMIDGLTLQGASLGGGLLVNGYADYLEISNNIVTGNFGDNGGGIIIGTPSLEDATCPDLCGSSNDYLFIHNNQVKNNSGLFGGGGISFFNGSDNYTLENNEICGNLSMFSGGGVSHFGISSNGVIRNNRILFNEVFYGGVSNGDGGGIFVGGESLPTGLTPGTGSLKILSNRIQGNSAGSGNGGGICLSNVNGQDVENSPNDPSGWYQVQIFNNLVVNNLAAFAGGAMSLQDSARVRIINTTFSNNDSSATSTNAMAEGLQESTPQPAGLVSKAHGPALMAALGTGSGPEYSDFSNPVLVNSIIWSSRSFSYDPTLNGGYGGLTPNPTRPIWDMEVIGTASPRSFMPMYCVLTDPTGYDPSNVQGSPDLFALQYQNDYETAAVGPEGGNAVIVAPYPLTTTRSDYHLRTGVSPAIDQGTGTYIPLFPELLRDMDHDVRTAIGVDIGSDESNSMSPHPEFIGTYRNGTWYLDANGNGMWNGAPPDKRFTFGSANDTPVTGVWNVLGRTSIGVNRNVYFWMLDWNSNGVWQPFTDRTHVFIPSLLAADALKLGLSDEQIEREKTMAELADSLVEEFVWLGSYAGIVDALETDYFESMFQLLDRVDMPVTGDWNGDGRTQIGLFRDGIWFLDYNGNGHWDGTVQDRVIASFGQSGDLPVAGDWNGDGISEIGVFRAGAWYLDYNGNGVYETGVDLYFRFGRVSEKPVVGDWAGNGFTSIGTQIGGRWYLDYNSNGTWDGVASDRFYSFGGSTDRPVSGQW